LVVGAPEDIDAEAWSRRLTSALENQGARIPYVRIERVENVPRTALGKAPLVQRFVHAESNGVAPSPSTMA
jgi:hypothetical protein